MKILVILRQVPDSTTQIKVGASGADIDRTGVKLVLNPFSEFAIELAVQLREKRQDVQQITALIAGPANALERLQTALAFGADDGIHVQDDAFEAADELQQASALAALVRPMGFDLVLVGKQEIDLDSGQLGPALAEALDLPHVGAVTKLDIAADGKSLTANRRIEGADEVVTSSLPALLTIEKGLVEARYPSLPNLMKAKKKPVKVVKSADIPNFAEAIGGAGGSRMHKVELPPPRPPGKVIDGGGDPAKAVSELVRLLREEAKVL
jgi:electron transfer flavoprotein beta subunit